MTNIVQNHRATLEQAQRVFDLIDVSASTAKEYKQRIKFFIDWVGKRDLSPNIFLEFKKHLNSQDYAISTKNKYLISARVFLKEIHKQGLFPVDATANVKGFKQNKGHKKNGLSFDEIRTIIQDTKNDCRIYALTCLFALQGFRQIEVFRLDIRDINFRTKQANVLGKGKQEKELIHLHPETVRALECYYDQYKLNGKEENSPLFFCLSNRAKGKRLTTRSIKYIFKAVFEAHDIVNGVHGFRHFFVTHLLDKYDGNLRQVRKYSRHSSLDMLIVYDDEKSLEKDLPNYYDAFADVL